MRYEKIPFFEQNSNFSRISSNSRYWTIILLAITGLSGYYYFYSNVNSSQENLERLQKTSNGDVWDTMDGEGYQFKEEPTEIVMDPMFAKLNNLPICTNNTYPQDQVLEFIRDVKKQFYQCITPIVNELRGQAEKMNLEWVIRASVCDKLPIFKDLKMVPFYNHHEIKWAIMPKCKEENVLVTLGIGHDTSAEEKFNRTVPNTKFFGADPIIEPNRQMYTAFGKFFPFAIGKEPGFTKFRVLPNQNQKTRKYIYQDVTTIPFLYFLHDILKLPRVDFAWIDIEGGEFEFLDQIHHEVKICQFNLEVHSAYSETGAQTFHDFVFKILEKKKYVFLQSMHTGRGVHRMFFINTEDKDCLGKYFNHY